MADAVIRIGGETIRVVMGGAQGPKGDTGSGGNITVNDLPTLYVALNDDGTDQAPAINAAIANPNFSRIVLPAGTYDVGGMPGWSNKIVEGQGPDVTILRRLPYAPTGVTQAVFNFAETAENWTLRGLTIDANRAGDGAGDLNRCNGIIARGKNYVIEDLIIENCTGYARFVVGTVANPTKGITRSVHSYNFNVNLETIGPCDPDLQIGCSGDAAPRDGGAAIANGCEAHLHQYDGASNFTAIGYRGKGGGIGYYPLINSAPLTNHVLIDCEFDDQTTAGMFPEFTSSTPTHRLTRLRMAGCRFTSPANSNGAAAVIQYTNGALITGCEFEGFGSGVTLGQATDTKDIFFAACIAKGSRSSGDGAAAYGAYSNGGTARWSGGKGEAVHAGVGGAEAFGGSGITVSENTERVPVGAGASTILNRHVGAAGTLQNFSPDTLTVMTLPFEITEWTKVHVAVEVKKRINSGGPIPAFSTTGVYTIPSNTAANEVLIIIKGAVLADADWLVTAEVTEWA